MFFFYMLMFRGSFYSADCGGGPASENGSSILEEFAMIHCLYSWVGKSLRPKATSSSHKQCHFHSTKQILIGSQWEVLQLQKHVQISAV